MEQFTSFPIRSQMRGVYILVSAFAYLDLLYTRKECQAMSVRQETKHSHMHAE